MEFISHLGGELHIDSAGTDTSQKATGDWELVAIARGKRNSSLYESLEFASLLVKTEGGRTERMGVAYIPCPNGSHGRPKLTRNGL